MLNIKLKRIKRKTLKITQNQLELAYQTRNLSHEITIT